jgi:hypothetical protein
MGRFSRACLCRTHRALRQFDNVARTRRPRRIAVLSRRSRPSCVRCHATVISPARIPQTLTRNYACDPYSLAPTRSPNEGGRELMVVLGDAPPYCRWGRALALIKSLRKHPALAAIRWPHVQDEGDGPREIHDFGVAVFAGFDPIRPIHRERYIGVVRPW